ncbi:MAG: hypothetical protein LUD72_01090 [Bacteroidales bacterium]|nr:hypothetical protein [Bacteroidales bacterium]
MKMSELKRELRRAIRRHGDMELCKPWADFRHGGEVTFYPAEAMLVKQKCADGAERCQVRLLGTGIVRFSRAETGVLTGQTATGRDIEKRQNGNKNGGK